MTERVHCLTILPIADGRDTDYVVQCQCGWESLPYDNRFDAVIEGMCDVLAAELEGARRRARRKAREQRAAA